MRRALWYHNGALELDHHFSALIDALRLHSHNSPMRLTPRLTDGKDSRARMEGVSDEHRIGVAQLVCGEIGDGLTAHYRDSHAENEAVDEWAENHPLAELRTLRVDAISVKGVEVPGNRAEKIIHRFRDSAVWPVLDYLPLRELLKVPTIQFLRGHCSPPFVGL